MPESLTLETEAGTYVIFFQHVDFVYYINRTIPGRQLDIEKCIPAIDEVKPPHRIFLDLECITNYLQQKVNGWENLSDEVKDDKIINFLITNINHESLHKAIFEVSEIRSYLEEVSYQLNDSANKCMEYIIAKMERG